MRNVCFPPAELTLLHLPAAPPSNRLLFCALQSPSWLLIVIHDTAVLHESPDKGVLQLWSVATGPPDGQVFLWTLTVCHVYSVLLSCSASACAVSCAPCRQQGRNGVLYHVQTVEAGAGARAQQLEASAAGVMSVLAGPHLSDAATATAAAILAEWAAHHCCTHLQSQVIPVICGCSSVQSLDTSVPMPTRELRAC